MVEVLLLFLSWLLSKCINFRQWRVLGAILKFASSNVAFPLLKNSAKPAIHMMVNILSFHTQGFTSPKSSCDIHRLSCIFLQRSDAETYLAYTCFPFGASRKSMQYSKSDYLLYDLPAQAGIAVVATLSFGFIGTSVSTSGAPSDSASHKIEDE